MKEDWEGIRKLVLESLNIQELVTEVTLREQTSISDFISYIYVLMLLTVFQSRDRNTQQRCKAIQCTKKRLKSMETFLKWYKVTSTEVSSFNVNIFLGFQIFCYKVKGIDMKFNENITYVQLPVTYVTENFRVFTQNSNLLIHQSHRMNAWRRYFLSI
jgi:hypothetical protein